MMLYTVRRSRTLGSCWYLHERFDGDLDEPAPWTIYVERAWTTVEREYAIAVALAFGGAVESMLVPDKTSSEVP